MNINNISFFNLVPRVSHLFSLQERGKMRDPGNGVGIGDLHRVNDGSLNTHLWLAQRFFPFLDFFYPKSQFVGQDGPEHIFHELSLVGVCKGQSISVYIGFQFAPRLISWTSQLFCHNITCFLFSQNCSSWTCPNRLSLWLQNAPFYRIFLVIFHAISFSSVLQVLQY